MKIQFELDLTDFYDAQPQSQEELQIFCEGLMDWFKDWQLHYYSDIMEWTAKDSQGMIARARSRLELVEQMLKNLVFDGTLTNGETYHYDRKTNELKIASPE